MWSGVNGTAKFLYYLSGWLRGLGLRLSDSSIQTALQSSAMSQVLREFHGAYHSLQFGYAGRGT